MSRLFVPFVLFALYFLAAVYGTEIVHESALLKPSNPANSDRFSTTLDLDGNTALIASPFTTSGGAVYEFLYANGNWTQTSIITDSSIVANDRYGGDVALDGNIAAIGATYHSGSGSAFVLERSAEGDAWKKTAEIKSSIATKSDQYGSAIDVSGSRIIVGASMHNDGLKAMAGSFAIFEKINGVWKETFAAVPDLAKMLSTCATAVAIDGDFAFVSCGTDSKESSDNTYAGSVMVYQRSSNGVWSRVDRLVASDGKAADWFGNAIDVEGNTLVVGAYGVASAKGDDTGAVYVFNYDASTKIWRQTVKLMAPDADVSVSAQFYYYFGMSVSLSGDDLVVGAYGDSTAHVGDYSGAAYLYRRDSTTNTWNLVRKMTRSTPYSYDRTAMAVGTNNGKTLLSCDGCDYNYIDSAGAALFFTNN